MGAWGTGSFDNDAALDWLFALNDFEMVNNTLNQVANSDSNAYLDDDCCCFALAAAEIIAICGGFPAKNLPDKVKTFAAANSKFCNKKIISLAKKAVQKIESSSDLQELFDEKGRDVEWHRTVKNLLKRLSKSSLNF
jgi:hypothetical protein